MISNLIKFFFNNFLYILARMIFITKFMDINF